MMRWARSRLGADEACLEAALGDASDDGACFYRLWRALDTARWTIARYGRWRGGRRLALRASRGLACAVESVRRLDTGADPEDADEPFAILYAGAPESSRARRAHRGASSMETPALRASARRCARPLGQSPRRDSVLMCPQGPRSTKAEPHREAKWRARGALT